MRRVIDDERLANIASAIRERTGKETTYTDEEMPAGVGEVYDAGKQAEYDAFWDAFQDYGNRTDYYRAFYGAYWTEKCFKLKYPIVASNIIGAFAYNSILDFKQHCLDNNITIDLTQCTSCDEALIYSESTSVPDSFGNTPNSTVYQRMFYANRKLKALPQMKSNKVTNFNRMCDGCWYLETVEEIDVSSATITTNIFWACDRLKEIRFVGEIPISISFQHSPLSIASLKSIITHLKNYAGTDKEYTYTLTLSSVSKTALEAEGATSPNNNLWTEYIDDLGWILK